MHKLPLFFRQNIKLLPNSLPNIFNRIATATPNERCLASRMSTDVPSTWLRSLSDGKKLAAQEQKPLMLVVHRPWCGACKKLIPMMKNNEEIRTLNESFVTVEMTGEDEAAEEEFKPDGAYVPRILFLSSTGEIMKITNDNNMTGVNVYAYKNADDLIASMRKAIASYS